MSLIFHDIEEVLIPTPSVGSASLFTDVGVLKLRNDQGVVTVYGAGGSTSFASLTGKPTTIAGYGITDSFSGVYADLTELPTLFSGSFTDLTSKPTTLAGYGIVDAATWLAPVVAATTATTSTANINWAGTDIIRLTLAAATVAVTMAGAVDGQRCLLEVIQDGTGGRLLTFAGTNTRYGTDITSFTLSTAASKIDRIGMIYNSTTDKYDVIAIVKGF
jgi:hypothetical protein